MLDQSFSVKNFRRILDLANRKGIHVEDKLSMSSIRRINENIRICNEQIREKRHENDNEAIEALFDRKKELREQKESGLQIELEKISNNIALKNFKIELHKVPIPGGKTLYTTPNSPEHYFAIQQIQYNISRLFGVKQANRNAIVEQVISLLGDKFPKFIIRTDIKDFYESIEHGPLLDRIHRDNLLSPFSRKILLGILQSYMNLSGSNKGIPRGIGVSAYLAELYMRDIDKDIKDLPGVTYYARYVDDIIILFTPSPYETNRDYLQEVKNIVETLHNVKLNSTKTKSFDLRTSTKDYSFTYLGYQIFFGTGPVMTLLTTTKVKKYRDRIKQAFDHYINYSRINEKVARKILIKRVRFLTGNTRLTNNKKNILTGIYYSNRQLTDLRQIVGIDKYYSWQISHSIKSKSLKDRLYKYSFKVGYETKRFSPFTCDELSSIIEIWNQSNRK